MTFAEVPVNTPFRFEFDGPNWTQIKPAYSRPNLIIQVETVGSGFSFTIQEWCDENQEVYLV